MDMDIDQLRVTAPYFLFNCILHFSFLFFYSCYLLIISLRFSIVSVEI